MSRQLVINADDYGLNPAVSLGVLRAHRDGLVTSTSVVAVGRKIERSLGWLRAFPRLGVGLHATFIDGLKPITSPRDLPTLAPRGRFRSTYAHFSRDWLLGRIRRAEVERELVAQIQFLRHHGVRPVHLDFHNHLHLLPGFTPILGRVLREQKIPFLRVPRTFGRRWSSLPVAILGRRVRNRLQSEDIRVIECHGFDETGLLGPGRLRDLMKRQISPSAENLLDLTVHPHVRAGNFDPLSSWNRFGVEELRALCESDTARLVSDRHLTNYAVLAATEARG